MILLGGLILAGGMLGVSLRGALQLACNGSLPLGTWVANLLGCLIAGSVMASLPSSVLKQAILIGFCGALTTLSSVCLETVLLWEQERYTEGLCHFLGTGFFCLFICFLGFKHINILENIGN
ncbi:MAG: CrcB family protein [Oligoflexales bacterium]